MNIPVKPKQVRILHDILLNILPKRVPPLNINTVNKFGYKFSVINESFLTILIDFKREAIENLKKIYLLDYFLVCITIGNDCCALTISLKQEYQNQKSLENFISLCRLKGLI